MLNTFLCRPVIMTVLENFLQWSFTSSFWYPFQSLCFVPVIVTLSPMVNFIFASCRFVMFSTYYTICNVVPESTINLLLSYFWFGALANKDFFVYNSFCCVACRFFLVLFLRVAIFLFLVVHLAIILFIFRFFILVVTWSFFWFSCDSIPWYALSCCSNDILEHF